MGRQPRVYQAGVYSVTVRGNSNELLFKDTVDYEYFLNIIKARKEKYNFKVYAYCLMARFYQLLIETNESTNISKIMQALNTSYALFYNKKYHHIGHIVAGRFEARLMNKDNSLSETIRRIHLNPLQLRVVKNLSDYQWSSYADYAATTENKTLTDTDLKMGTVRKIEPSPFSYAPDYQKAVRNHLALFRKYYLVPVSALLIFLVILSGQPKRESLKVIETLQIERNFVALPDGLPQSKLAINLKSNAGLELPVGGLK